MTVTKLALDPLPLALVAGFGAVLVAGLLSDAAARRQARFASRLAAACPRAPRGEADPAASGLRVRLAGALEPALAAAARAVFARPRDREEIRRLLAAAGYAADGALAVFATVKLVAAAVGGIGGWFGGGALLGADASSLFRGAAVAGCAVAGAILPEMALRARRDARKRRLREALPDAIDLMVIAAHAGQSLDMAIDRVARELRELSPDLGDELSATLAEMQTRPDRGEALRRFGERLDLREAQALAMTLIQTIRYGAPFTDSLRALGGDLRRARMLTLEERGAKLPALLTLPLIVFILPAVFVVVVGPAVVAVTGMFAGN